MRLNSLKAFALVIDVKGDSTPLAPGSTVALIEPGTKHYQESVLSPQDKMIGFVNKKGKFVPGWIGQHVLLGPALSKTPETIVPEADAKYHPWDEIRRDMDGLTADSRDLRWWTKRAKLVSSAVREFGAKPVNDVAENVRKLCKLVNVESPQLEGKEMPTTTVKGSKKNKASSKAKASTNGDGGARKRLFSRTVGQDIIRVSKYAGVSAPQGASALANDRSLSRKALIELRDNVNATSAELREDGSDKARIAALALSHVVMGVQRLSREAK